MRYRRTDKMKLVRKVSHYSHNRINFEIKCRSLSSLYFTYFISLFTSYFKQQYVLTDKYVCVEIFFLFAPYIYSIVLCWTQLLTYYITNKKISGLLLAHVKLYALSEKKVLSRTRKSSSANALLELLKNL